MGVTVSSCLFVLGELRSLGSKTLYLQASEMQLRLTFGWRQVSSPNTGALRPKSRPRVRNAEGLLLGGTRQLL